MAQEIRGAVNGSLTKWPNATLINWLGPSAPQNAINDIFIVFVFALLEKRDIKKGDYG